MYFSVRFFTMPSEAKASTLGPPSAMGSLETQQQHDDPSKSHTCPSAFSRAWGYLNQDVRASGLAEAELLILTFCIGLQGKCF